MKTSEPPKQKEPRAKTLLRSMIHALNTGDSDTYWMTLGILNTLHREMIESVGEFGGLPSIPAAPESETKTLGGEEA